MHVDNRRSRMCLISMNNVCLINMNNVVHAHEHTRNFYNPTPTQSCPCAHTSLPSIDPPEDSAAGAKISKTLCGPTRGLDGGVSE